MIVAIRWAVVVLFCGKDDQGGLVNKFTGFCVELPSRMGNNTNKRKGTQIESIESKKKRRPVKKHSRAAAISMTFEGYIKNSTIWISAKEIMNFLSFNPSMFTHLEVIEARQLFMSDLFQFRTVAKGSCLMIQRACSLIIRPTKCYETVNQMKWQQVRFAILSTNRNTEHITYLIFYQILFRTRIQMIFSLDNKYTDTLNSFFV